VIQDGKISKLGTFQELAKQQGGLPCSGIALERINHVDAVVYPIAHIHTKPPRLTKQGFVARGAAAMPVAGGVALAIRLRFHNHAPEQPAIRLAFYQQAADELRGDDLGGAGEEGLGEG
jgi:hypothetical protein